MNSIFVFLGAKNDERLNFENEALVDYLIKAAKSFLNGYKLKAKNRKKNLSNWKKNFKKLKIILRSSKRKSMSSNCKNKILNMEKSLRSSKKIQS